MTVFWKLLLYLFEYLINLLLFELNVVVLYVSDLYVISLYVSALYVG